MRKNAILRLSAIAIVAPLALAIATGTASAGCQSGYVWRDAQDGDGVCVTPDERTEAKLQNANATNHRVVGGGAHGPNTCRDGYVWREAFAGDMVCVTPSERHRTQEQNALNAGRSRFD